MRVLLAVVLLVPTLMSAGAASAQQRAQAPATRFRLYPSAAADSAAGASLTVVVPADGVVPVTLVPPLSARHAVDLVLSPFADPRGSLVEVRIALAGDPPRRSGTARRGVRLDSALVRFRLEVGQLPSPDPYAGYLFITRGEAVLQEYKLSLRRAGMASPAKLVLDRQTISLSHSRPLPVLGPHQDPRFTVMAREETGDRQLEGVTLRLMETDSPSSAFDPQHDLTLVVNGDTLAHPWTLPPKDTAEARARRIPAGGQMLIEGLFSHLPVGEHRVRLRITAANSQEDPRQELTITLTVRHWIGWAVLALFLSVAFSYLSTKYLNIRRQRLAFARRLADQRPRWLRDEPPILAVVWVRTIFRQAQDLTQRWHLAGTEVLEARIGQASETVKRLEAISKIRAWIKGLQQDPLVVRRAQKALRSVESRLGAGPLDPKLASTIDADLTQLEEWCVSMPKLEEHYWSHLKVDIDALLASVDPEESAVKQCKCVGAFVAKLQDAQPTDLKGKVERERVYCKLKLLWERRAETEFGTLVQLCERDEALERLFIAADQAAWKRLHDAVDAGTVRFVEPRKNSPEAREAYEPLLIAIAPDDRSLGENYLFQHGIQYTWHLTPPQETRRHEDPTRGQAGAIELIEATDEPRVIQYASAPGKLTATVDLCYGGASCTVKGLEVDIAPSTEFTWRQAVNSVELWAVALSVVVALVTGLSILYVGNATFGTLKDYISVFLWGAGVDQTKNFLQTLQGYSGAPGAAVAGGTP